MSTFSPDNGFRPREVVQAPPHEDELEAAIEKKIESVLAEQSALAKQRLDGLYTQLEALSKTVDTTQKRAKIALKAHAQALVTLRKQTEQVAEVAQELVEGLKSVDDAVKAN